MKVGFPSFRFKKRRGRGSLSYLSWIFETSKNALGVSVLFAALGFPRNCANCRVHYSKQVKTRLRDSAWTASRYCFAAEFVQRMNGTYSRNPALAHLLNV